MNFFSSFVAKTKKICRTGLVGLFGALTLGTTACKDDNVQVVWSDRGVSGFMNSFLNGNGSLYNISYEGVEGEIRRDIDGPIEVKNEESALNAFFRGNKRMSHENYGEAEKLFEECLKFYIPDLDAVSLGKTNLVHKTANIDFLKGLHEKWAEVKREMGYSGTSGIIERNAKDAWALSLLIELTSDIKDDKQRAIKMKERFQEVRGMMEGILKYSDWKSERPKGDYDEMFKRAQVQANRRVSEYVRLEERAKGRINRVGKKEFSYQPPKEVHFMIGEVN